MSIEDLTIKEMRNAVEIYAALSEAMMRHALVILADPDHNCGQKEFDKDDLFENMPEFDEDDIKALLSMEEAALSMFAMLRVGLIANGWTELTTEVGS